MSCAVLSRTRATPNAKGRAKAAAEGLRVNQPNDAWEQEADRLAEAISAGIVGRHDLPPVHPTGETAVQRQCACGGSGKCGACDEEEQWTVRRKAAGHSTPGTAPPIVHEVLGTPGRPLDWNTRSFFESRLRHSFAQVRIHTDGHAAASARAVDALAYTVGNHVVFGTGRYDPSSAKGRKLLAHELAHAMQQSAGSKRLGLQRAPTAGWTGSAPHSLNQAETAVGKIRRIPIEGLTEGNQQNSPGSAESAVGRAIVLLHQDFDASKPADVMFFFHGHNEGFRMGTLGNRDRDVDRLEQQMEAAGNQQLIGILPQGTADSGFGGLPPGTTGTSCNGAALNKAFNTDAYLTEVFNTLVGLKVWNASPAVRNVMLSGHSGGGELINQGLLGGGAGSSLPQKLGTLKEVALYDAVNGPCEFVAVQDWLERTLRKELGDLSGKSEAAQLQYLKTSVRFRSYFERSQAIGDYYSRWNIGPLPGKPSWQALLANRKPLEGFLSEWFKTNAASLPQTVQTAWRSHYQIVDMGKVAHDDSRINIMTGTTPTGSTPVAESISVLPKREPGAREEAEPAAAGQVQEALRSASRPLTEAEHRWARRHFGHDFRQVRVHTGTQAVVSARALKSLAYTVGEHIVLDPSRYNANSRAGRRLLGHELAHVLQQGAAARLPDRGSRLAIGRAEDPLEQKADQHALTPGPVAPTPAAKPVLRRVPAEGQLAKTVCETTANPPKEEKGECNYARPENCPTYESWLQTFTRLKTFVGRATPAPGTPTLQDPNTFSMLGAEAATRLPAKPDENSLAKDPKAAPFPTTGLKLGETFIDHPTDAWVKSCLPDNLRATAYQLPSDCADIAIILRHVWLAAHHRTQTLQVGRQTWVIGDEAGGPGRARVLRAISDIGSQSVTSLVQPYSDPQGHPLVTFAELAPLLHPGDILVWEHHDNGLDKPRTGGHTLTITAVNRRQDGTIESMSFLQGNEPIFGDPCPQGVPDPGGFCAGSDDKGKIIQQLKLKDTSAVRAQLGEAPGRRIETASTSGPAPNGMSLNHPDLLVPAPKKGDPPRRVWGWGTETILLAAGPPRAVNRPPMATPAKGMKAQRRITDWIGSFGSARSYADWQAVWEGMLLEARAFVEGGRDISQDEATRVGDAAGRKLWSLAKQPRGTLGDESHFARLQEARRAIDAIGASRGPGGSLNPVATRLRQSLQWLEDALDLAARGVSDLSFGAGGKTVVKTLLTGFDPFDPSGSLKAPAKGTWNPAGAAVLALDNQVLPARSSKGRPGTAQVQGVVLPVSYDRFQAGGQGLLESVVASNASDLDAAITVSMDPGIAPTAPVRLERYVVGVHDVPRTDQSGQPTSVLEPIPAAGSGTAGDAIIESNAPLDQIAADTEKKTGPTAGRIPRPDIGEKIVFRFASSASAAAAVSALNGVVEDPRFPRDVTVSDHKVIEAILASMVRQANGTEIAFRVGTASFTATVVQGPGGNFLSNEVSYRMLRLLKQLNLPQAPVSFHVHTQGAAPIPQDTSTAEARKARATAQASAGTLLNRLVQTLKGIIIATAKVILDRRAAKK
ncbi:MAG: DUF4157 domain-containing protein [Verrucomicrobia bacterium]|nr:DUF4157 domain-containing protein [Verrucomicrobiota bacterium]